MPEKYGQNISERECLFRLEGKIDNLETVLKMSMAAQKQVNDNMQSMAKQLFDKANDNSLGLENIRGQLKTTWFVSAAFTIFAALLAWWKK